MEFYAHSRLSRNGGASREQHGIHLAVELDVQGRHSLQVRSFTSHPTHLVVTRLRKRRAGGKGAEVRRVFGVSRNVVYRISKHPGPGSWWVGGEWKEDGRTEC